MELLNMSSSAAMLVVMIVIIRALVMNKLPKKTFIVLWGVALYRLLIPFSLPSPFSIYTMEKRIQTAFTEMPSMPRFPYAMMKPSEMGIINTTFNEPIAVGASSEFSITPMLLLTMVWFAGTVACGLFFIVAHLRCRREYKAALPIEDEFIRVWLEDHSIKRPIKIRQSDKISAPLTYGILKPVILLPKAIDWENTTELGYVLMHEFVHVKRFDLLMKWLLVIALCVHWFNPFVWLMYTLANRDLELSCDEAVVLSFGETAKSSYALTLIGWEEKRSRLSPLSNHFSKNATEERIKAMMKIKKTSFKRKVLAFILVLGMVTTFATTATSATTAGDGEKPASSKSEENLSGFDDYTTVLEYFNRNKYTADSYHESLQQKYDTQYQTNTEQADLYFSNFSGSKIIYELNDLQETSIGFSMVANFTNGEMKIAFINENEGVLRTGVTNHWLPISRPIDFPAGRNWVVLVGEQVTGECNITLYH